jgi:hypothetical protein
MMRPIMGLDAQQIKLLLLRYLPVEVATQRAQWLAEDLGAINFDLQLTNETPEDRWIAMGVEPQIEYVLTDPGYDINSENEDTALSGSFITVGNLLRLSQIPGIARQLIANYWPAYFSRRLLGREHLDALNEIWWLKHWRGIVSVQPGPKPTKAHPDYEWTIEIKDGLVTCGVNLEVKRRPGNINGWFKKKQPTARFGDVAKKFKAVSDDIANVVAMTVYVQLSADTKRRVLEWFESQPDVHGVVIWLEGNLGTEPMMKLFKSSRKWAEHLLWGPDPEDLRVALHCAGTLCKRDEVADYLKAVSQGLTWRKHVH